MRYDLLQQFEQVVLAWLADQHPNGLPLARVQFAPGWDPATRDHSERDRSAVFS
jgi:hypothetical protein